MNGRLNRSSPIEPIAADVEASLWTEARFDFYVWLLMSGEKKLNRQLFYVSVLLSSFGLSGSGLSFLSHTNICLDERTFLWMKQQVLAEYGDELT